MRVCSPTCIKKVSFLLAVISATVMVAVADVDNFDDHGYKAGPHSLRANRGSDTQATKLLQENPSIEALMEEGAVVMSSSSSTVTATDEEELGVTVDSTCGRTIQKCTVNRNKFYIDCLDPYYNNGFDSYCARGCCHLDQTCFENAQRHCKERSQREPASKGPLWTWRDPDDCNGWKCGYACEIYTLSPGWLCKDIFCNGDKAFTDCSYNKKCWAKVQNGC